MNMGPNGPRSIALGSEAALCLVDIDKPDIQLPEELPIFPHRTPFIEELNHVLDKHQVNTHNKYFKNVINFMHLHFQAPAKYVFNSFILITTLSKLF